MGIQLFLLIISFLFKKNFKNKFKYKKLQKCHKTYPHCICLLQLKYILKNSNLKKKLFLNIFPPLPFTGFTDFTGKFHFFYQFTGKFKTR
jgi:hypothetical protein